MKYIYLLSFYFLTQVAFSQNIDIRGRVKDSAQSALPFASVLLLRVVDSVMVEFGTTDDQGNFKLKARSGIDYILQISFMGFDTYWQYMAGGQQDVDLGDILLQRSINNLPSLQIVGELSLMKIGRDTVEYNAKAFKVQPGAAVEELLKRLPGLEVQRDGSVKAYGENVQNVLVDGKEFFGKDTRIATKNLEADAIDKVQVFDKKSDVAEFTGVDDGRDEKTINLKLKEDRKNGYFGNAELAGGTSERFKSKFNLNRFSPQSRLSIIGSGNNINEQNFSFQDYLDFMGGIGAFMSGGGGGKMKIQMNESSGMPMGGAAIQGIQRAFSGGINFSKDLSSKTDFNASYLANNFRNVLERNNQRQSLLAEEFFNSEENEDRTSGNNSHTMTFKVKTKLDSFQNLILRGGGGWNDNHYRSILQNTTFLQNRDPANQSERDYNANGSGLNFNSNLTWQRKFRKSGRSLVWSASGSFGNNNRNGFLDANNQYFLGNTLSDTLLQNQLFSDRGVQADSRVSFTEPLGKKRFIELNGLWSNNRNRTNMDFFDIIDPGVQQRNDLLSNKYNRGYQVYNGGLRLIKNHKKYYFSMGINLQHASLSGKLQDLEQSITTDFTRLLPGASLQYELGTANNLNIDYETQVQEPSLEQLQPTSNNTDPLNIYVGNPNLKPEYTHELNSSYFKYDQFSFTSVFARLGVNYTQNKITEIVEVDSLFKRTIRPVNVKDEKAVQGGFEISTPVRPLFITTKLRLRSQFARSILFVNDIQNKVNRLGNSVYFSIENRKKDFYDAMAGIRWSGNQTAYSVSNSLDQTYNETNWFGEITYTPNDNWAIKTEFDRIAYTQSGQSEKITVPLWQASLTRYFTKQQRLRVTLSVFDILNQNKGVNRSSQLNYQEVQRTNVLGRYFMLGMAYSIKGFKKSNSGIEINIER